MTSQYGNFMQQQDILLLLTKQFSGELTKVEAAELQHWLRQSPDNERIAADLQQVWTDSGTYAPGFAPDLDADFKKVQARIRAEELPRARVIPLGRYLMRIAALLAFLVMATWAYHAFQASPAQLTATAQDEPKRQVDLPDGSHVWLRQGSSLDFPQSFTGTERRVQLRGEAYFEVAHRAKQPFRVELSNGDWVEVLGTQFDVCQNSKENSVLVRSGKVRFQAANQQGNLVTLEAGEKAVHDLAKHVIRETKVPTFNELAWQTGGLEFIATPLSTVVTDLEEFYHVKILLRNAALQQCLHTAPLTSQPLEKVLQTLSLTYNLQVLHTTAGQYELVGGTCQ